MFDFHRNPSQLSTRDPATLTKQTDKYALPKCNPQKKTNKKHRNSVINDVISVDNELSLRPWSLCAAAGDGLYHGCAIHKPRAENAAQC